MQVQEYLGIRKSGIYDASTRRAVTNAQMLAGLEPVGVVDYETFVYLRDAYSLSKAIDAYTGADGLKRFPYSVGDFGEDVRRINTIIKEISFKYGIREAMRGSIYTESVGRAVMSLRGIFGLPEGEHVDEVLYGRIKRELLIENRSGAK